MKLSAGSCFFVARSDAHAAQTRGRMTGVGANTQPIVSLWISRLTITLNA